MAKTSLFSYGISDTTEDQLIGQVATTLIRYRRPVEGKPDVSQRNADLAERLENIWRGMPEKAQTAFEASREGINRLEELSGCHLDCTGELLLYLFVVDEEGIEPLRAVEIARRYPDPTQFHSKAPASSKNYQTMEEQSLGRLRSWRNGRLTFEERLIRLAERQTLPEVPSRISLGVYDRRLRHFSKFLIP